MERNDSRKESEGSNDLGYESNFGLAPEKAKIAKDKTSDVENGVQLRMKRRKRPGCNRIKFKGEKLLVALTVTGVMIGVLLGFSIKLSSTPSPTTITLVMFPGELLMRMLKMLIIPIIATSIVTGLGSLDMKRSGWMGGYAILYYMLTTILAVILGIALVTLIHPGDPNQRRNLDEPEEEAKVSTLDTYLDLIRNIFPDNIIAACFEVAQTKMFPEETDEPVVALNHSLLENKQTFNETSNQTAAPLMKYKKKLVMVHNTNVMGVIVFFIAFGVVLSSLGEDGRSVVDLFSTLNRIFMRLIAVVIWYSPIGICSLIAGNILKLERLDEIGETLGLYMITVAVGLVIHGFIVLPIIFYATTRQNPYKYAMGVSQALLTALGTASSAGTLPVTMKCLEKNLGIDQRITQFVLPLGATMNMDGTALLEGVAAITIAQMYGIGLNFGQIITISLTATMASIGAAAIPSSGLVTLLLVLTAIGIPTDAVAIIWSIDWILDRLRTSVNVLGDCIGAGIVQHYSKDLLRKLDEDKMSKQDYTDEDKRCIREETDALVE